MNEAKRVLTLSELRALARYEVTFTELVTLPEEFDELCDVVAVEESYQMSPEDLYAAIGNLIEKNPTLEDFYGEWYAFVDQLDTCSMLEIPYEDEISQWEKDVPADYVRGLPLTAVDILRDIWTDMNERYCFEWSEEARIAEIPDFQKYLRRIELFAAERDKPIWEHTFSEEEKKNFIREFQRDERVEAASELELRLCRQFTNELCEKDSGTALHLKGYSCYGGNRLYPCDWPTARDCVLRLYEKTDDPQYANTLGYIYYYGRCTGGEPEYQKAYEMFTVSAANGLHEGMYKLADMFRHGYACKKSPRTARRLYELVYNDCLEQFVAGKRGSFADAALRMGNVYLQGIDVPENPSKAYSCYLQADYANRIRMEKSDFFGNTTVAMNVRKALDETKAMLGEEYFREYIEYRGPDLLAKLLKGNNRCALRLRKISGNEAELEMRRVPLCPDYDEQDDADTAENYISMVEPILLTAPELDWCELTASLTMRVEELQTSLPYDAEAPILIDFGTYNDEESRFDFYLGGQFVGWLSPAKYKLYPPTKKAPSGALLRLVTIRFQPSGRSYDYLCEDESVRVGDTVIVPGYDGDTEAEVLAVSTKYESELGIPMDRYKRAVKK